MQKHFSVTIPILVPISTSKAIAIPVGFPWEFSFPCTRLDGTGHKGRPSNTCEVGVKEIVQSFGLSQDVRKKQRRNHNVRVPLFR